MNLMNLKLYTPDNSLKITGLNVMYLRDTDGHDWYAAQKNFSADTVKIAYTDNGEVRQYSTDVSALWPENMSVGEVNAADVENLILNDGGWLFDGKVLTQKPKDYVAEAQRRKTGLLNEAALHIEPLQDAIDLGMATEDEDSLLTKWKRYRLLINRVDIASAPDINWPEQPV